MFYFHGKAIGSVGLVGLGKSNLGVLSYLFRHHGGLEFTLRSSVPTEENDPIFKRRFFASEAFKDITEDILFLSPSVRRDIPELMRAENAGVILSSDAELFFDRATSDVYAVSGSDGKSTTTYLTSRLLGGAYKSVFPCGNIGEAMTPHLDDREGSAQVTELSSFQLSYMKPKTKRAVITNITKNHLNWHKSFEEYIDAKRNILFRTDERIINFDCPVTRTLSRNFDIFAVFSKTMREEELKKKISAELYLTVSDGIIVASGEPLLDTKKIRVGGEYNILNFMAAISMSYGKCEKSDILGLAEEFGGLPHRCELICESDGVRYYDSSIDSSPKRCAATLSSFDKRVTVILGGRSKGLDFSELLPTLSDKAKRIVLTGECAEEIKEILDRDGCFSALGIPYDKISDFKDAVSFAARTAEPGDSVLLSPAATSYDSFKSFEERGEFFARIIKEFTKR